MFYFGIQLANFQISLGKNKVIGISLLIIETWCSSPSQYRNMARNTFWPCLIIKYLFLLLILIIGMFAKKKIRIFFHKIITC